jgi:hypothetical protein
LAIEMFESDADVIANAADRQMAHLRTFQAGAYRELSQRLLNEVAAARLCLLAVDKKAAYDGRLRASLPSTSDTRPISAGKVTASAYTAATMPPRNNPVLAPASRRPKPRGSSHTPRSTQRLVAVGTGAGLLLTVALAYVLVSINS